MARNVSIQLGVDSRQDQRTIGKNISSEKNCLLKCAENISYLLRDINVYIIYNMYTTECYFLIIFCVFEETEQHRKTNFLTVVHSG